MNQTIRKGKIMNTAHSLSRPRLMRTHFPVQLLPDDLWVKKPRIIHCSREAKDVAVSNYHFGKHYDVSLTLKDSLDNFINDKHFYGPYREHCLNYRNIPDYQNILYLTYESVIRDIDEAIQNVAEFLKVKVSKENARMLKEYLKFDNMKSEHD